MAKVKIGESEVSVEKFSGYKFIRALRLVRAITEGVPEVVTKLTDFTTEYERKNNITMSRSQALFQFGAPPVDVEGNPMVGPDGKPLPGRLDHLSDEDWEKSGNRLDLPRSPSTNEQIMAVFPTAFDLAEREVLALLGLLMLSNRDLERADDEGGSDEVGALIEKRARELPHQADADQLLEVAVVAIEVLQEQFEAQVKQLDKRLGNVRRLFGLKPKGQEETTEAPETEDSQTRQTLSTDSPDPTDGIAEPLSTEQPSSSSASLEPV